MRHQPAVLQFDDGVATPDRRKSVRDEHNREIAIQTVDGIHHRLFGGIVQGACRLVEHQNACLLVERAGNADALTLTAGKSDAALTHRHVIAFGPAFDELGDLRLTRCLFHPIEIDCLARHSEGDVLGNGRVGEINALRHVRDTSSARL